MAAMLVAGLRVEDRLAGVGNWSLWKARIVLILEELELWDIVEYPVVPPTDAVLMVEFQKRNSRACYPQFLGITKEMMSRGPQVANM
jgi:hypothetical protein